MNEHNDVQKLIACLKKGRLCTPGLLTAITRCASFFSGSSSEITGISGITPLKDQLRMELRIAQSAVVSPGCEVLDVGSGIGGAACRRLQPRDLTVGRFLAVKEASEL